LATIKPVATANNQTMPGVSSCWAWDWLTGDAPFLQRRQFYRAREIGAERNQIWALTTGIDNPPSRTGGLPAGMQFN
jgi:hypothetical protein